MNILIVDDSKDNLLLLQKILNGSGYTDLLQAESAEEALKLLVADGPAAEIDLILMDLVMQGIDGIEACRLIKSMEHLRDIPIIMITAETEEAPLERAFAAGAIDYIRKPLRKIELLARIRSALTLKEEMDRRKARERELTELTRQIERANQALQMVAVLDALTGISNRRRFDEVLDLEWRRALREGKPLSLIMIDIDFFKAYNDTYGHLAGDDCLRKVASSLKNALLRSSDFIARYGGEEFSVILPETAADGAFRVAERLRSGVESLKIKHAAGQGGRVTISVGVATTIPLRNSSGSATLAAADRALYQAKHAGRNQIGVAAVDDAKLAP